MRDKSITWSKYTSEGALSDTVSKLYTLNDSRLYLAWFYGTMIFREYLDCPVPFKPKAYTVATMPSATTFARTIIWVADDIGGETLAYSNGTNWLRVSDGSVISAT